MNSVMPLPARYAIAKIRAELKDADESLYRNGEGVIEFMMRVV